MIFQSHHNSLIKLGHFGFEFWRILGDHSVIVQTWFRALIMLLPLINLIFSWSFLFIYFIYLFMFYSALSMFCCREKLCMLFVLCYLVISITNSDWVVDRCILFGWSESEKKFVIFYMYLTCLVGEKVRESEVKFCLIIFWFFIKRYNCS